ncbi:vWA domain-containing protein [Candidatus Clostridium stratigraminis]|uniref:VWA domain-containing protein n=1 Tax=Candidatus Clostridium stratigraminis TaxID=3381661 RepID=A0ABW8T742_9CLOT
MRKAIKIISLLFFTTLVMQFINIYCLKAAEVQNNIILLMDVSGSMKETDPKRLSIVAASMLIDSSADNTNLNIVTFGDKAKSKFTLESKPSKEKLKGELANIKFDNSYTDLKDGIKEALLQLSKMQGNKSIILLSDGKEDIRDGITKEHKDEFASLIDKAHSEEIKINCIALSNLADKAALQNIAFKTEGQFFYSNSPSQLINVYSKLIESINNFFTIKEYEISDEVPSEIKLSSYVQEITVKIASLENKTPLVDIMKGGAVLSASKLGDGYKIYNISNKEDCILNVSPRDNGKYLVIIQIKSKSVISIKPLEKDFSIPKEVPLKLNVTLTADKDIVGLHMDKVEGTFREPIERDSSGFNFTFNKAKSGEYEILVTAYDGQGRIIAVNNLRINVTDDPPFYYKAEIPKEIVIDKPYKIVLKQLSQDKVINPSGEIIVDYGDKYEKFPLKIVDNYLTTEVTLHKLQEVSLTVCVNGVFDNDSFSYFLPQSKVTAVKRPLTMKEYYYEKFKIPMLIIFILSAMDLLIIVFQRTQYKRFLKYSITKELTYKLGSKNISYFLTVTLTPTKNIKYLNLKGNTLEAEDEENNGVGYLLLDFPKGSKIFQGLKYLVLKDKAFKIEYYPSMEQQVYKEEEEVSGSLLFEGNIRIIIKVKKDEIIIYS